MRLLIDMNLTVRWVPALASAGHEVIHWSEIGSPAAPDSAVCQYARVHGYALLTNDLDIPRILVHTPAGKPSVVLLRGEPLVPESRGAALIQALEERTVELETGAVVQVHWSDRPRTPVLPHHNRL